VSRSIFVDRLCCSRSLPALQVPEKQVDTEEHYNNYNNYEKTKRNGDDDHDDAGSNVNDDDYNYDEKTPRRNHDDEIAGRSLRRNHGELTKN